MPINTDMQRELELLTESQVNSIKDIVLNSIKEILPNIINEITPTIINSAEKLILEKVKDTMPATFGNQQSTNIVHLANQFEFVNSNFLNNKLKARNDYHYKETRSLQLSKLYDDCLKEESPYVPKVFREERVHTVSTEEEEIYSNLAIQRVRAEIEVLNLRARTNREKIDKIDSDVNTFFTTKMEDQEVIDELEKNWQEKTDHDQQNVMKQWAKKINDEKSIITKDKAILTSAASQQIDSSMSLPVDTNSEQSQASAVPKPTRPKQPLPKQPYQKAPQQQHQQRPQQFQTQQQQQQSQRNNSFPSTPHQGFQRFQHQPYNNASKNYQGLGYPRPPPHFQPKSSTFLPSPWHTDMFHY